jgi:hypothetical protein
MYEDFHEQYARERMLREHELAEGRRLVRLAKGRRPRLRGRIARALFSLAVRTERGETWDVVWERLEARGRL